MKMKNRVEKLTALALAGLIGGALSISPPSYAQDSTAGRELHQSGSSMKEGSVGDSAKHAYNATKDQIGDATLTTKVKTALLRDSMTKKYTIHVESDHGTVSLGGSVDSRKAAEHARKVVAGVHGVETVKNHLTWPMAAN